MLLEIIRELMEEGGAQKIDFGFGDAKYKEVICNENWQEASVYIFSPTFKAMRINAVRSGLPWYQGSIDGGMRVAEG